MRALWAIGTVAILLGCVSRTVPSDRVAESRGLSPPPNAVSVADPANYSFAAVGDLHVGSADTSRLQSILRVAKAEGDAFIVLLGDIVDKGGRSDVVAVRSTLAQMGWEGKAFAVIGNHDIFDDGWTNYKEFNGPSFYTFTVGNSKFIALDTADATLGSEQLDWLETEFKKESSQNLFLLSHYLPVIPGQRSYLKLSNQTEATHLMKLASDHRVAAWLGGHYHSYIQSVIDGVLYVVAGGGGGRRMEPVLDYFFVQVQVSHNSVTSIMHKVD